MADLSRRRSVVSGARAKSAGRSPDAAAVALGIADFLVRSEVERTALFREHLAATVDRVSPLLTELAVMEGLSIADAVVAIRPPEDWPWRALHDHPPALYRRSAALKLYGAPVRSDEAARFRRTFAAPGVVLRDVGHPRGCFAIRPCGRVLGFSAALGGGLITCFGTSTQLKLPHELPDTLMLGLPGRQLGQLVDHPLFRDAPYRISRVEQDFVDGLPVIFFRTRLIRTSLPPVGRDAVGA